VCVCAGHDLGNKKFLFCSSLPTTADQKAQEADATKKYGLFDDCLVRASSLTLCVVFLSLDKELPPSWKPLVAFPSDFKVCTLPS